MVQQGVLEILSEDKSGRTILDKFDGSRPLPNFLYIHVRNRLFNFKRDNYVRPYVPCENCPFDAFIDEHGDCSKYVILDDCEVFTSWSSRNISRRNIMNTLGLDQINDYNESGMKYYSSMDRDIDTAYVLDIIESELPVEFREDYTLLKYGHTLSKNKTDKLRRAIEDVLDKDTKND